jgi:alkylated DNA repair dioxygenase AlkB
MFAYVKMSHLIAFFERGFLSGSVHVMDRFSFPSGVDGKGAGEPVLLEFEWPAEAVSDQSRIGLWRLKRLAVRSESAREHVESLLEQYAPEWSSLTGACELASEEVNPTNTHLPIEIAASEPHRRLLSAWRAVVAASPPEVTWLQRVLSGDFTWLVGERESVGAGLDAEQATIFHLTRRAIDYLSTNAVADAVPAEVVLEWLWASDWLPLETKAELEAILQVPTGLRHPVASELHELLVVLRLHLRSDYLLAFMKQAHRGVAISDERRLRLWFLCGLADTAPLQDHLHAKDVLIRHALSESVEATGSEGSSAFLHAARFAPAAASRDLRLVVLADGEFALRGERGEWLCRKMRGSAGWSHADWVAPSTLREAAQIASEQGWRDLFSPWGAPAAPVRLRKSGAGYEPAEPVVWEVTEERFDDIVGFQSRIGTVSSIAASPTRLRPGSFPVWDADAHAFTSSPLSSVLHPSSAPVESSGASVATINGDHSTAAAEQGAVDALLGPVVSALELVAIEKQESLQDTVPRQDGTPSESPSKDIVRSSSPRTRGVKADGPQKTPRAKSKTPNVAVGGDTSAIEPDVPASSAKAEEPLEDPSPVAPLKVEASTSSIRPEPQEDAGSHLVSGAASETDPALPFDGTNRRQFSLFSDFVEQPAEAVGSEVAAGWQDGTAPDGLIYVPRFLTEGEAEQLVAEIDARPWQDDLKRRVQHYGFRYDYKERNINRDLSRTTPLPERAEVLAQRISEHLSTLGHRCRFTQMIVNEYEPGQGISAHIDHPAFRGPVVSVSLLSAVVMNFEGPEKQKYGRLLEPGSMVVLAGPARETWTHAIKARKNDKINGKTCPRGRRVSLTYRVF